jgi:hypothetical protein
LPIVNNRNYIDDSEQKQSRRYEGGKNTSILKQQLESAITTDYPAILLSNKIIHRPSHKIARGIREAIKIPDAPRENTKKEQWGIRVPTQTLPANTHIYFSFNLRARDSISYEIESEYPVSAYVVDTNGLNSFKQGLAFTDYGGFLNQTSYRNRVKVPLSGDWYLIINNSNYQNTAIHYQVN